jgi:hypothetical protein
MDIPAQAKLRRRRRQAPQGSRAARPRAKTDRSSSRGRLRWVEYRLPNSVRANGVADCGARDGLSDSFRWTRQTDPHAQIEASRRGVRSQERERFLETEPANESAKSVGELRVDAPNVLHGLERGIGVADPQSVVDRLDVLRR